MSDHDYRRAVAGLWALALAGAAAASLLMFSTFMFYDDEGYVLISLRSFVSHGHLYNDVYSQYGPFPYAFYALLHGLGLPLTQVFGRIVTLIAWATCALAPGLAVLRTTRSLPVAAAAVAGTFVYLWAMTHEPTHPGGLVTALVALLAWSGTRWASPDDQPALAFFSGAALGALVLTKINMGGLAVLSVGIFVLLHARAPGLRRAGPWLAAGLMVLVPVVLMKSLAHESWVQKYALLFVTGGVAAIGAIALRPQGIVSSRRLVYTVVGGLVLVGMVVIYTLYRGTTLTGLMEGVVLGPLRHPSRFNLQFRWPAGTTVGALLSLGLFVAATRLRRTRHVFKVNALVAAGRLLLAAGLATLICYFPRLSPDEPAFAWIAPALWIFLWPLPSETDRLIATRNWIGLLLLGQFLHAFPVPGTQVAWGTFLAIPVAALGAWGAAQHFDASVGPAVAVATRGKARRLVLTMALLAFSGHALYSIYQTGHRETAGRNLNFEGTGPLRLPDNPTALYRILSFNAIVHADMLFSLPGMFSLNLWTQLPTPTLANATHWFSLLDEQQQREIIAALSAHPRAAVIRQREHVEFLQKHGLSPSGIAYDYIEHNYSPAFSIDDFEFLVRKGREIALFFTAEIFFREAKDGVDGNSANTLLKVPIVLPPQQKIARIEILRPDRNELSPLLLGRENSWLEVAPIDLMGHATGPARPVSFPLEATRPLELRVYFDRAGRPFPPGETFIVLRGEQNEELALVRLRQ